MSLRAPPKPEKRSRGIVRTVVLLLVVALIGVAIWAAVTNRNLDAYENVPASEVDLAAPAIVGEDVINVVHHGLGSPQVILLHDVDVTGGPIWEQVIDELGVEVTAVTIDLPGFGLSTRHPEIGEAHTVASMAEVVVDITETRFPNRQVIFAGVGLGAEIAAEVAVTRPDLMAGLVMIDADFYATDDFLRAAQEWPFIGPALTHAFHGGGPWYERYWSTHCGDDGGWCPSAALVAARERATRIVGTNASLRAFLRTPPSSLVPSLLGQIETPTTFIWSTKGPVPENSVQRVKDALVDFELITVEVWKAHLDAPTVVADAILAYGS